IALKYLNDAGIIAVMGATAAYTRISLKVTGSGTVSETDYTYNGAQTSLMSGANRQLDVVWAPDINLTTCPNLLMNPDCFDASGQCGNDSCTGMGPAAWCCKTQGSGALAPVALNTYGGATSFTGPDGSTYYCPCGDAGSTAGSSLGGVCSIDNFAYNPT